MQTIILDLDGTLLDCKLRHYRCYQDILTRYQVTPLPIENYWQTKRQGISQNQLLQLSQAQQFIVEFSKEWSMLIEREDYLLLDTLYEQVLQVLQTWQENGFKLFLVTFRQQVMNLQQQLKQLQLIDLLEEVIAVPIGMKKSEVIAKKNIAKNSQEIIWIGDTEADVQAARELNIKVCALSCGLRDKNFLKKLRPDYLEANLYLFAQNYSSMFTQESDVF